MRVQSSQISFAPPLPPPPQPHHRHPQAHLSPINVPTATHKVGCVLALSVSSGQSSPVNQYCVEHLCMAAKMVGLILSESAKAYRQPSRLPLFWGRKCDVFCH